MKVMTYKDMIYSYSEKAGYFKENSHMVEAELTKIYNEIMADGLSNGNSKRAADTMQSVLHINRSEEFPFKNIHKVIPTKNGILKINPETYEITLEDLNPNIYKFNYVFPINYNPKAPTEPVLEELKKYVSRPGLIIQMFGQIIAQTLTDQPFKKAYFLFGQRDYGKSFICIELAERFLEENSVSRIPLSRLSNDDNNKFSLVSSQS